jgi:hypothetical protein
VSGLLHSYQIIFRHRNTRDCRAEIRRRQKTEMKARSRPEGLTEPMALALEISPSLQAPKNISKRRTLHPNGQQAYSLEPLYLFCTRETACRPAASVQRTGIPHSLSQNHEAKAYGITSDNGGALEQILCNVYFKDRVLTS